jgi:ferrochelatase
VTRGGILLINLGTPDAPTPEAVGTYLREFLMDPWVIDIPRLLRWFLVNVLIVPRRKHTSAALYRRVWTPEGSPLLTHTRALTDAVAARMPDAVVRFAMRYGNPSIPRVLEELRQSGVDRLTVAPLYPQYSLAASESSARRLREVLAAMRWNVPVRWVPAFYDDPGFLDAVAAVARPVLAERPFDAVLFSFHGLPERQVQKTDRTGAHCLRRDGCCDTRVDANRHCYRAQSFATARELAKRLQLGSKRWFVGFQSRLGNTPWIRPHSDFLYDELPKQGIRRLAVLSPSFVSDCLETLEEIALRGAEQWKQCGGEELFLVPCVNASPAWADALVRLLDRAIDHWPSPVADGATVATASAHSLST